MTSDFTRITVEFFAMKLPKIVCIHIQISYCAYVRDCKKWGKFPISGILLFRWSQALSIYCIHTCTHVLLFLKSMFMFLCYLKVCTYSIIIRYYMYFSPTPSFLGPFVLNVLITISAFGENMALYLLDG